jgi:hypothetical protein
VEEMELQNCTFQPKTKWDIKEERRQKALFLQSPPAEIVSNNVVGRNNNDIFSPFTKAEKEKIERNRRYEEAQLRECTFRPKTRWTVNEINGRNPNDDKMEIMFTDDNDDYGTTGSSGGGGGSMRATLKPVPPPPSTPIESATERGMLSLPADTTIKLVSQDSFQEETGKKIEPTEMFRRDMVRQIVTPKSPEWKQKYRKIGQNRDEETELAAQGHGASDTIVRGHAVLSSPSFGTSLGASSMERPTTLDLTESSQSAVDNVAAVSASTDVVESERLVSPAAVVGSGSSNEVEEIVDNPLLKSETVDIGGFKVAVAATPLPANIPATSENVIAVDGLEVDEKPGDVNDDKLDLLESILSQQPELKGEGDAPSVGREDHPTLEVSIPDPSVQSTTTIASSSEVMKSTTPANETKSKKTPKAKKWIDRLTMKKSKEAESPKTAAVEDSSIPNQEEIIESENRRLAEAEKKLAKEAARVASETRIAQEKKLAEEARVVVEQRRAKEAVRLAEEKRLEDEALLLKEKRLAEETRRAKEAEITEKARVAELARVAEVERLAEEARVAELSRIAEAERLAEEDRAAEAEAARLVEEARLADETRAAEEARIAEDARVAEAARLVEEARLAEETRAAEDARVAEVARLVEEGRLAEKTRVAEEARIAEEARLAAAAQVGEKERLAEETTMTEEDRFAEEKVLATTDEEKADDEASTDDDKAIVSEYDTDTKSVSSSDSLLAEMDEEEGAADDDKPKKKMKSDRAKKWKDRLKKKSKKGAEDEK